MAFATTQGANLLKLIFQAVAWANMADNAASAPFTNLYISLHTASPGVGGSQTTNEAAYTGYARVAVVRTSSGFAISGLVISNVAAVTFPQSSSGPESETFAAIGTAASGAGTLLAFGALNATLVVNNLITPSFAIGALTFTLA